MSEIFHFVKHLFGLCGEAHPSILVGGGVFLTTIGLYWTKIINYMKDLF
jgi:hypothetical protein|tara:strand:+ start:818 stop:964 length:147 start_codon:yes stop_codon:yes gene_type:complete